MSHIEALRRKAAGLLVVRLGSNMQPPRRAEEDAGSVHRLLERYPLGGVILFNGAWPETRETLVGLQRAAPQPLLVMTDMERGLGQQVGGATTFPHAMAFGALADRGGVDRDGADAEAATEAFARASAREALACGVHAAFAPVCDVNRNPQNPIISTRAFGETAERVARLAAAYVRGCRAEGLLSTAKHFPGHGNTHEDSHAVLPTVSDAREEIEREDLPPFRAALAAGCELVMSAHVAYPALDPSGRPATLSAPILRGLLRDELGFEGAVISDSLHMGGIQAEGRTEADLAVEQVRAGMDLLLDPQDPERIIEGLARAVEQGELEEARLDDALARAQRLRDRLTTRFGDGVWLDPGAAVAAAEVGSETHDRLAARVARAAVRTEGEVPFGGGEGLLAVLLKPHASHLDPPEQPLGDALREALPGVDYREVGPEAGGALRDEVVVAARQARAVLAVVIAKPAAWQAFGLPEEQAALARRLVEAAPAAVAALGSPRGLDGLGDARARLVTFSDAPVSQRALADVLADVLAGGSGWGAG